VVTRSEKIRRLFRGKDRAAKMIAISYAKASVHMLEKGLEDRPETINVAQAKASIADYYKVIETLQRQDFVLNNPKLPFEICRTGDDDWSGPLYIPTSVDKHRLYRVILDEENEILFLCSR
jgi:hypothetical protein